MYLCKPKETLVWVEGGGTKKDDDVDCDELKFIREGEDTCWIDTSMYIMIVPNESYKILKPVMHEIPELLNYVKRLRRDQKAFINRCTPGGGNEMILMEKMIKTMGLNYMYLTKRNEHKVTKKYPDYLFKIVTIPRNNVIPKLIDKIKGHKLIGMLYHVEYKDRPEIGHVACAVLCECNYWRYYNNCNRQVVNLPIMSNNKVANTVRDKIQNCKASGGPGSRIDTILLVYCRR